MYQVAIVGASGLVGREMIRILEERKFPVEKLYPFTTQRSCGQSVKFRGEEIAFLPVEKTGYQGIDLALFAGGEIASSAYVPQALKDGALVIDNSSYFRMGEEIPLIVPEVNPQALQNHSGLIANPNCCAIPLVLTLKPLADEFGLTKVVVTTYQSVSGSGKAAIRELTDQVKNWANRQPLEYLVYPHQIAFNLFAEIGPLKDDGYFDEEEKVMEETRKILAMPNLSITATCVRVPVIVGHSLAVYLETEKPVTPEAAKALLGKAGGVKLEDFPTPLKAEGKNEVLIGRIRKAGDNPRALAYFCSSDNLRLGAALNAVKIAEKVLLKSPEYIG